MFISLVINMEIGTLNIKSYVKLVSGEESNPIVSAYFTSDIANVIHLDGEVDGDYQSRLVRAAIGAPSGPEEELGMRIAGVTGERARGKQREGTVVWKNIAREPVKVLLLRMPEIVCESASLCFYVTCEIDCGSDGSGSHFCGWGCVQIRELIHGSGGDDKERNIAVVLTDTGKSRDRGAIELVYKHSETAAVPPFRYTAAPFEWASIEKEFTAYYAECQRMFIEKGPSNVRIRSMQAPLYKCCGGMAILPPCAFIAIERVPMMREEYYIKAVDAIRLRWGSDNDVVTWYRGLSNDEQGCVLMEVAQWFPTSCVYLFDKVLSSDGQRLISGEEFSRQLGRTLCGDCEDGSFIAAMALREILQTVSWHSTIMRLLQEVRKCYFVAFTSKAVTKPSTFGATIPSGMLGVHATVDLIPAASLAAVIDASTESGVSVKTEIKRIASNRRIDSSGREYVIVGESTGRTIGAPRRPASKNIVAAFANGSIAPVETAFHDDVTTTERSFYKYMVWLQIDDLDMARYSTTFMVTTNDNSAYGAPHPDYLRCDANSVTFVPLPRVPQQVLEMIRFVDKFEVPVELPRDTGVCDTKFAEFTKRVADATTKYINAASGYTVRDAQDVYVPLWMLTDVALAGIFENVQKMKAKIVGVRFENIVDGIAFAVFMVHS